MCARVERLLQRHTRFACRQQRLPVQVQAGTVERPRRKPRSDFLSDRVLADPTLEPAVMSHAVPRDIAGVQTAVTATASSDACTDSSAAMCCDKHFPWRCLAQGRSLVTTVVKMRSARNASCVLSTLATRCCYRLAAHIIGLANSSRPHVPNALSTSRHLRANVIAGNWAHEVPLRKPQTVSMGALDLSRCKRYGG